MKHDDKPTGSAVLAGLPRSASRFTFMTDDGRYPTSGDGRVQWVGDRAMCIELARSFGCSLIVDMDSWGRQISIENLNEPNGEICGGREKERGS